MSTETGKYYPFLDGFRALAILWVILHHMNLFFKIAFRFPEPFSQYFDRFSYIGLLGVDVFFVISGFLISGLLFDDLSSRIRIKRFYFRRFFKIFPQYLLIVFLGISLTAILQPTRDLIFLIFSYLLLFQNYVFQNNIIAHLWSIAVEEHFYFLYPILLQGVCFLQKNLESRRRMLAVIFLVIMVLVFIIRRHTFIAFPYNPLLLFQQSHLRFDALIFGCLIKIMEPHLRGFFVSRVKIFPAVFFVVSLGLFCKLYFSFDPCRSSSYVYAYLASGFLLMSALCGFKPLLKITQNHLMRWMGKCSYATYLWHYPIIYFAAKYIFKNQANIFILLGIPVFVIIVGALSTMTIERYFLNMRKKIVP